jgi:hypothetical protein
MEAEMPEHNEPVTRESLQQELAALETRILEAVHRANEGLETKLLTAFHSYARGVEAKIRVAQTIGLAGVERLDALEARVLDIEQKLLQR